MPVRILLALLFLHTASAAASGIEREVAGVVDLFYDMDFDRARAASEALAERHPSHPAGPFYRGVSSYQRWIAEGMRSTETLKAFEDDNARAGELARAMLRAEPAEAHYYLGVSLGLRSRAWAGQRKFARALPDGAAAVKHLKKALALDPALTDARLGMGMYHYFAARMPAGAKPFAYLLVGEGPDRALGLKELWSVAESTGVSRMEARSVLATILSKEDEAQWDKADELLVELCARYPRNPIYRLRRAYVAGRRGDLDAAARLADPDGKWIEALHPAVRTPARAWALYRASEARLLQGRAEQAQAWLAALDGLPHPRGMKDWVLLRRGNLLDGLGRAAEADALYARIRDKKPAALAARFRRERWPGGPKDTAPFFTGY